LQLVLPRGESIEGAVGTLDGEPIPGAVVYVRPGSGAGGASTTTDDQGRFRADGLAPGRYSVTAFVESIPGQPRPHANDGLRDVPTGARGVVLTLRRAVKATGVVVDSRGQPVARARLAFSTAEYWRSISASTDELGQFRVALPERLVFDVFVSAPDGGSGARHPTGVSASGGDTDVVVTIR